VPETKQCQYCNKSLVNKRSHSKHCSSSCRSKTYRLRQKALKTNVSVKLTFTKSDFDNLKKNADSANILINQFIINKVRSASFGCAQP
jgi:hypothetical protein